MGPLKIAFSTRVSPAWGIELTMTRATQYGFDGVEVEQVDDEPIGPGMSRDTRRRVLQASQRGAMPIVCVASALNVAQPDTTQRAQTIRDAITLMDIAASWSAPYVRVYADPPADADPAETLVGAREALETLGARGRILGVAAVVEMRGPWATGAQVAAALVDAPATPAAGADGVGALWDVAATQRAGEGWQETISALADRLRYVHLRDGRPSPGAPDGWEWAPLGEGTLPLRDILRALVAARYDGWLTVGAGAPPTGQGLATPEEALPRALATIKRALRQAGG